MLDWLTHVFFTDQSGLAAINWWNWLNLVGFIVLARWTYRHTK